MENRDRDKLSRKSGPTSAGDVNRDVSSRKGQEEKEDISNADFGKKIGQSEDLEPKSRQGSSVGSSGMKGSSGNGRPASTGMGKGNSGKEQ